MTGAMTPLGFEGSGGLQDLTEGLFAIRFLNPGIYIVMPAFSDCQRSQRQGSVALYLVRTRAVLSERRSLRLSRWFLREQTGHPFGCQRRRKRDSQRRPRVVRHQDSCLHEFRYNPLRLPHSGVQDFGDLSSR